MEKPRYIVVEGPIGVGKTSLVNALARHYQGRTVFEIVEENPFLPLFYTDRDKYAFQTQVFFLLSRYKQQQEIFQQELFARHTVSDYLFAKDRIFAGLTLKNQELGLYERVFEALGTRIAKPDLVVNLQARMDVLGARIKKRGRDFERSFDMGYLEQVCQAYTHYFAHYTESPLLTINVSDVDYVGHPEDLAQVIATVEQHKEGRRDWHPMPTGRAGKHP